MSTPVDELLDRAADWADAGARVALCLLVRSRGSTPAPAGAMMIVDDAARLAGTIGGGCVEAEVRRRAVAMLGAGESGVLHFRLDHDYGWDDGLICGGSIDVAVAPVNDAGALRAIAEAHRARRPASLPLDIAPTGGQPTRYVLDLPPRPRLLIAGAGHIGQALCRLTPDLGFDTVVIDDRADLLERFIKPPAQRITGPIAQTIAAQPIDAQTYIVIVTRGHRHDEQVLHAVIELPAAYIGMIGSKRKVKLIFDDLRSLGITDRNLERVRAPIGIDIGSITVPEIALSIAAELVAIRRASYTSPVRTVGIASPCT